MYLSEICFQNYYCSTALDIASSFVQENSLALLYLGTTMLTCIIAYKAFSYFHQTTKLPEGINNKELEIIINEVIKQTLAQMKPFIQKQNNIIQIQDRIINKQCEVINYLKEQIKSLSVETK